VTASYVIVWEYRVRAERTAAFERAYGPDGDCVSLCVQARAEYDRLDADLSALTIAERLVARGPSIG
jgi:hypothetical protein